MDDRWIGTETRDEDRNLAERRRLRFTEEKA
jgi:hypothetical protein